jgi:pimeloyl-ACP methyl ester carboxylesterase
MVYRKVRSMSPSGPRAYHGLEPPRPARRSTVTMSRKKSRPQVVTGRQGAADASKPSAKPARAASSPRSSTPSAPATASPRVSGRWLLLAILATIVAAIACAWGALCLLFWQGSWQLLYRPSSSVARTPASASLPFDSIAFADPGSGAPRLTGWWIPAAPGAPLGRYTVLYFHGQDGNLGDAVDHLAQVHAAGTNVFAFDYRGYGQSQFAHPGEKRWLEDAGWAFQYLTATRHIDPGSIVVDGSDLGADLALEFAAAHPQLAGVVLESPLQNATDAIFNDARARLVPAGLLVSDRWELTAPAAALRVSSLWFLPFPSAPANGGLPENPEVFRKAAGRKMFVWLPPGRATPINFASQLTRWLDDLQAR